MNLPQVLTEQLQKRSGLISLSVGRESDPGTLLKALTEKVEAGNRRSLMIQREDLRKDQIQQKTAVLNYNQLGTAPVRALLMKSDIIFMEDILTLEELELALYLAEAGSLVVAHSLSRSINMTIQRILSWLEPHQLKPFFWRLAETLHFIGSAHLVNALDGGMAGAWEVCLMNSDLRVLLREIHISEFSNLVTKASQKPAGTVSLNQSLLQLLVQRKIDIKSAFDTSLDPEDLDGLLKKVGI